LKLDIFGLGYVGCVSAACLAEAGHEVIGVDVNQLKVDMINQGHSPVVEPRLEELVSLATAKGRLRATINAAEAVEASDVSMVCVGTPGRSNGSLDLRYVKSVCEQLGRALELKRRYHIVVIRSTVLPGATADIVVPTLEVFSGKRVGREFGIALNPEFLREGTSVEDFQHPPFTLIGADDEEVAGRLRWLYSHVDAASITMGIKEAEMVKYACNSFHAIKVTFANEISNICQSLGVDCREVMQAFCRDTKLNLSSYYLKPGFAFGGSCLPKDLRALSFKARELDVEVPLLDSILVSNRRQVARAVEMVLETGRKQIAVLGLSFKTGTDDLRESPMVTLVETLIGKGLKLAIYDREVQIARLFGANKEYIEHEIPHISSLMRPTLAEVLDGAEVIVIGKDDEEFRKLAETSRNGQVVIDLVRGSARGLKVATARASSVS